MTMISDSGAIHDISEIAAGLSCDITEEESSQIDGLSMEELIDELGGYLAEASDASPELIDELGMAPAMESLIQVVNEIKDSGSISRADADAIGRMTSSMEGFEDTFKNLPLISFTELPSKVNFDASMEGLVGDIFRKIIEVIKKIWLAIKTAGRNFVNFIKGNRIIKAKSEVVNKRATEIVKESIKKDVAVVTSPTEESTAIVDITISTLAVEILGSPKALMKTMTSLSDTYLRFDKVANLLAGVDTSDREISRAILDLEEPIRALGNQVNREFSFKFSAGLTCAESAMQAATAASQTKNDFVKAFNGKVSVGKIKHDQKKYVLDILTNCSQAQIFNTRKIDEIRQGVFTVLDKINKSYDEEVGRAVVNHDEAKLSTIRDMSVTVQRLQGILPNLDSIYGYMLKAHNEVAAIAAKS